MIRCAILAFVAAGCAYSQVSARVSLSNGIQLRIETRSNNGPVKLKASLEPASGDSFYRIFRDENNLAVFAYELQVTRTPDGQSFHVVAKAATEAFATRFPNADGGKPTPTLSAPLESPLLKSGGQFTIPIPTAPELDQMLTDNVQVGTNDGAATGENAPTGQIRFSGLKIFMHGKQVSAAGAAAKDVAGRFAMFYLPGHGGYFFSTAPVEQPSFLAGGVVDGKHLSFTIDNEVYDCIANAPILGRANGGELWVYHDPNYKPAGNWTKTDLTDNREEFFTAASNSIQWWLR